MMLKEKSSKWARLKLLLLLPLGTLTVFAFARPDVNEAVSSSADYESTINFEENEIKQSLNMQDNAEKGIVVHINMKNRKNLLYYPIAYDEAKEGEKPIHDKFVKYMAGSKEYTREGFEELIKGKMYFKTETNIKSKDNVVLEFHCITQKGVKTPTLYMLKVEDETPFIPPAFTKDMEPIYTHDITIRDKGNKRKSTERFVAHVIKIADSPKGVLVYIKPEDKRDLFSYPISYVEAKEGEKAIYDDFVKYAVGSKEYTREGFVELIKGKMFVYDKEEIKSYGTDVMEFHCTTQKGLKTPTWYMVKVKEGTTWKDLENEYKAKENNKSKNTVKFVPPVIKRDNPEKEIVTVSRAGDNGETLFLYPAFYCEEKEGKKTNYDRFVKYIVGDKEYTPEAFEKLVQGRFSVINKSDIESDVTDIIEFHCITQKGLKTPTWYMVKMEESKTWRDRKKGSKSEDDNISISVATVPAEGKDADNKSKSTAKFVPPVIKKDAPEKKIVTFARSGDKGEVLYSYPVAYNEAKEGEKPIRDNFKKYIVGDKEYTREEFGELVEGVKGNVFVCDREEIKSYVTDVMEFHCTTQKGLKTPTWYMVKVKEGTTWKDLENEYKARGNNKSQSTAEFVPPTIIKK